MTLKRFTGLLSLLLLCQPSLANDWGYEGEPPVKPPVEEQSAASMLKSIKKAPAPAKTKAAATATAAAASKASQAKASPQSGSPPNPASLMTAPGPKSETTVYMKKSKPADTGTAAPTKAHSLFAPHTVPQHAAKSNLPGTDSLDSIVDKDQQAARCWLQLFQVVSKQRMDFPEQKKLEVYMLGKARQGSKQSEELRSILSFWPKLMTDLRDKPELEVHYSDLFRALLRLHERESTEKTNVEGSEFSSDADMLTQLLGLQRIAVDDNPPFTEDAVNAYADMAFFIYEQNHAGRTIEASDNRTLFAKVVVEKFNRAPTEADRRAMASFDLAWAKFKIIWFSAGEKNHQLLMEKLVKSGAGSTLSVSKNPLLDLVLRSWPWKSAP